MIHDENCVCDDCSMAWATLKAAGDQLVREVEALLRFRASVTVSVRRAP